MSIPIDVPMTDERKSELCKRPFIAIFPEKKELIWNDLCTTCRAEITESLFENKPMAYRKEFNISGMCPACQDKVF